MKRILLLIALVTALPAIASADQDVKIKWGEIPRDQLFATHFAETPDAEAVVLWDHAIARVDKKDRLKYYRHHRTKIFKAEGLDRGIVRIPYGKDYEIKNFRAQTIIPPGHLIEVKGNHKRTEQLADGSHVLVVEFPSVQPGAVIEYEYVLRRDELYEIPAWSFRGRDPVRTSRFELQIPAGMTHSANFSWVPGLTPKPVTRVINDPEDTSRRLTQLVWELTNQPALANVPLAGASGRYAQTLYVQLGTFTSTFKNFTVDRPWSDVGVETASMYESFFKKDSGVADWAQAAGATGAPADVAVALHRHVRDAIRTDATAPGILGTTLAKVVESRRGASATKNALLTHLLRENGIPADLVLVRRASHGPMQAKYHAINQFDHAIVRAQIDGEVVWADTEVPGCPFGVLPPDTHVDSGLLVSKSGSDLVNITVTPLPSGRQVTTSAQLASNGSLRATSTVRYEGWYALHARGTALMAGGEKMATRLIRDRFGATATLDSFELKALEDEEAPLVLTMTYRVPDYASRRGDKFVLRVPYLTGIESNPLEITKGAREHPVRLGFAGVTKETVVVKGPEGWGMETSPRKSTARSADLRYKTVHAPAGDALSSTRTFTVREPVVAHTAALELQGVFEKIVSADASELVLIRQATRTSSTR